MDLTKLPVIEGFVNNSIKAIERKIDGVFERAKKSVIKRVFHISLLGLSILCVLAGVIMFLSRFFPTDLVLIVVGALFLYAYLIINSMQ